jgi:hypothetical protein
MAVFRYLYTIQRGVLSQSADPQRGIVPVGWLSGLTMLIGSNVIVFAAILIVGSAWVCPGAEPALWWLISASILWGFLFFAAFCAQFTGKHHCPAGILRDPQCTCHRVYYIIRTIMDEGDLTSRR